MTIQSTHTPGPWRVTTTLGQTYMIRDRTDHIIAEVRLAYYEGAAYRKFPEANAALIAAAPDLLAALKGMLDQPETNAAYDAMMERANAALAKAEGRTP